MPDTPRDVAADLLTPPAESPVAEGVEAVVADPPIPPTEVDPPSLAPAAETPVDDGVEAVVADPPIPPTEVDPPSLAPAAEPTAPAKTGDIFQTARPEAISPHVGWRLKLALALTLPLVALEIVNLTVDGSPISSTLGSRLFVGLQAILGVPVVFICGWPILVRAWSTVRTRRPDFYTLVGMGIGAALMFSVVAMVYDLTEISLLPNRDDSVEAARPVIAAGLEAVAPYGSGSIAPFFEGAAVMVVLVLLGLSLEERARERAGEAIRKLIRLTPKTARVVLPDGREEERPLGEVHVGDLVRINAGARIPVDGMIREGNTTVDESVLTGEPMRSGRGPGMVVMAGTENGLGTVTVQVQRVNQDTALAHVIALVARAQRARAPLQRTSDRIAAWLIPLAIVAATATYAGWMLLGPPGSRAAASVCAIGVLVAACPVALGLAAPTAVVVGMGRASKMGILFRDGAALERLAGTNTVLFDKTGTLTEGRMKLIGVEPNVNITVEDVLALAAAVERGSIHPIGLSIVWEASRRQVPFAAAEAIEEIPGKGIRGTVHGHRVAVGRIGFIQESGAHFEIMFSAAKTNWLRGHSVVFVSRDERCIGLIVLNDPLRVGAEAAVAELVAAGVRPILVSGDHADTVNAVAQRVGIEIVVADTMPAEKYAVVQAQRNEGRSVAMCGDGVNDAPALAAADVGIAMGTGTEIAVSTAGVALAKPDLRLLLTARELSRATVRTIKQNLAVAFVYTAFAVPIAAGALFPLGGGLVNPVWQAAGMAITSLIVVANSQRLGR
jgi:P-type Cu+ transporter